ncbi:MAG TPA: EVE domain-containing protein [Oligoflexia bacterium]|nr:EVE domain-containing protein [Oligoflexia bacterium]HMP48253.1 EVE domain-containing protein [Oligoflexia bacterium]
MNYWLVKTEEDVYPIDSLKKDKETSWDGVRNYQARNFLKEMKKNDLVFIYHSNATTTGITGLAEVKKTAEPDELQFDKKSDYFDPASTRDNPRWFAPTLKFKEKFKNILSLSEMKEVKELKNSQLLKKGNRLSVMPMSKNEAEAILSFFNK